MAAGLQRNEKLKIVTQYSALSGQKFATAAVVMAQKSARKSAQT